MKRVLKWDVPVDDRDHQVGGGPVVLVACQGSPDVVQVWTLEAEPKDAPVRNVRIVGTGQPLPEPSWHLGSTMAGPLVWHLVGDRP